MNSIGIPTSRTTPKTEVSHGPRTGLRQRSRGRRSAVGSVGSGRGAAR